MARRSPIELKSAEQILRMRSAGLVVARTLQAVRAGARPGVTTADLDAIAREQIASAGAVSSFLGYGGGFFDRTLARLAAVGHPVVTLGVGFDFQRVDTIHPEPHDAPLMGLVTESGFVEFD